MQPRNQITNPFVLLVLSGLCGWGAWETQDWLHSDLLAVPVFLALGAVLTLIKGILYSLLYLIRLFFRKPVFPQRFAQVSGICVRIKGTIVFMVVKSTVA